MLKVLLLQAAAIMGVAMATGLWVDSCNARTAALSALAGGAAYFLPNLLFAARLFLTATAAGRRPASAISFFLGEALKLSAIIAILFISANIMEIYWPALLAGLFVVMFVNLFALLLKT